jgi:hypothetical protein
MSVDLPRTLEVGTLSGRAGGASCGRRRASFLSIRTRSPYERIGPAASHICNGRTSHQRHESPKRIQVTL